MKDFEITNIPRIQIMEMRELAEYIDSHLVENNYNHVPVIIFDLDDGTVSRYENREEFLSDTDFVENRTEVIVTALKEGYRYNSDIKACEIIITGVIQSAD